MALNLRVKTDNNIRQFILKHSFRQNHEGLRMVFEKWSKSDKRSLTSYSLGFDQSHIKLNLMKLSCQLAISKSKKSGYEDFDVCLIFCKGSIDGEKHRIGYLSTVELMNKSVTRAQRGTGGVPADSLIGIK
jgi:hypothetical protein